MLFENFEDDNLKFFKNEQYSKMLKVNKDDYISALENSDSKVEILVEFYSSTEKRVMHSYAKPLTIKAIIKDGLVKYEKKLYPVLRKTTNKIPYILVEYDYE